MFIFIYVCAFTNFCRWWENQNLYSSKDIITVSLTGWWPSLLSWSWWAGSWYSLFWLRLEHGCSSSSYRRTRGCFGQQSLFITTRFGILLWRLGKTLFIVPSSIWTGKNFIAFSYTWLGCVCVCVISDNKLIFYLVFGFK